MTGRRPRGVIVAGTDTGVGKTVVSAGLVAALDGAYWKPVQAGLDGEADADTVMRLSGLAAARFRPSAYRLAMAASPHIAAAAEGIEIEPDRLALPDSGERTLIVETAGGVLVPLSRTLSQIDMIGAWGLPVVLVARTTLGTINHSLLTLEALRRREIEVGGIVFVGEAAPEVESTICERGQVRRLGRLERTDPLDPATLSVAFGAGVDVTGLG